MPDVPWTTVKDLRHELSGERQIIKFIKDITRSKKCKTCIIVHEKAKRIDYNIQAIQTKLDYALERMDEE